MRGRSLVAASSLIILAAATAFTTGAVADSLPDAVRSGVANAIVDARVANALESEGRVRVLVTFRTASDRPANARPDAARSRLAGPGFEPGPRFERIPVMAASVDAATLARLLDDPNVLSVGIDPVVEAQLAQAVPLTRLDFLHTGGLTGEGTRVAIVDTGVDLDHPDLIGSVVDEACFCDDGIPGPAGCCPNGLDEHVGVGAGQDDHGHGTRVAGIVTSAAVHAPLGGAPDTELIAVKVLSAAGTGTGADFLAGLDWVLTNHPEATVVNMSLGFGLYPGDCDTADASTMAFASAVDLLHAAGTVPVAGSGNDKSTSEMIVPACIAKSVSVGAVWDADLGTRSAFGCTDVTTAPDQITCFSNSSTTTDVVAPGGIMTSSLLDGTTVNKRGTSFAAPMVAACAAVLAQAHPAATVDEISLALTKSAVRPVDAKNGLAYPRLDCHAAHFYLTPGVPTLRSPALSGLILLVGITGAVAALRRFGRAG